jgi:phosphoribosylanthranilate isomerase
MTDNAMPKRKRTIKTNNDPQNTSQKTKDLTTQTLQIHGRVSSSYNTSVTRRVTLFKNAVLSHKEERRTTVLRYDKRSKSLVIYATDIP